MGRGSFEQFHGAVVNHTGRDDTRVFQDVSEVGILMKSLSDIAGSVPTPKTAVIYDWENRWAIEDMAGAAKQDKKYKEFHSGLCPNTDNIIGVRIPKLREIAKEIAKQNAKEFLQTIDTTYYETIMLYGMVIGYAKLTIEERQKYLDIFVPQIDNWAVCDCCTSTYKFTNKNKEQMWKYIQKYLHFDRT